MQARLIVRIHDFTKPELDRHLSLIHNKQRAHTDQNTGSYQNNDEFDHLRVPPSLELLRPRTSSGMGGVTLTWGILA